MLPATCRALGTMAEQISRHLRSGLTALLLAAGLAGCASAPPPAPAPASPPAAPERHASTEKPDVGARAARIAVEQVGVPYRYGGTGPTGFDCSGLVQYSYRKAGKSLPRTTGQLWNHTVTVPRKDLRAGDLLFFSIDGTMQHVGLYLGDGHFVHAPSSGRTVTVESLRSDFYRDAFLRAGRPR